MIVGVFRLFRLFRSGASRRSAFNGLTSHSWGGRWVGNLKLSGGAALNQPVRFRG